MVEVFVEILGRVLTIAPADHAIIHDDTTLY